MKKNLSFLLLFVTSFMTAQNALPTTGNVGIGTTNPSAELDVKGNTQLESVVVKDQAEFEKPVKIKDDLEVEKELIVDQNVLIKGETEIIGDLKGESDLKILGTTKLEGNTFIDGQFRLNGYKDNSIQEDRFLMIRPNGKIEVFEKGGLTELMYGEAQACFPNSNGDYPKPTWTSEEGNPAVIYTADNCPANVGIGTDDPQAKLDVHGKTHIKQSSGTTDVLVIEATSNSSNNSGIGISTIVNSSEKTALSVYNTGSSSDVINIYGDGRLNITHQNDSQKSFHVSNASGDDVFRVMGNGNVFASKIRVSLIQQFPDYVFHKDYDLLSLEDVNDYIAKNKRLPKMPTAENIAKEGMDLGEINRLLVEKVEELTLYLIQLNQENQIINEEMEELKQLLIDSNKKK